VALPLMAPGVVVNDVSPRTRGRPRELYARPATLFVARFIGSPEMNLYEAALDDGGDLVLGSQRLALGSEPTTASPASTRARRSARASESRSASTRAACRSPRRLGLTTLTRVVIYPAEPRKTGQRRSRRVVRCGIPLRAPQRIV
jgi:ABC-type sugar transport system ATPase subunit